MKIFNVPIYPYLIFFGIPTSKGDVVQDFSENEKANMYVATIV